ncbi:GerAB/ArcD/ProY family transporter [Heyndrickxia sp. NPDC080065]|uniref:GerAB/ArcD/ProY family transporter n=1 Tax=Heyndrickxia sp. NPDC080065 TaxID=3390568 RepID=UPI003D0023DA
MSEKVRISASQMGAIMYPTVIATGIINLPLLTGQIAKQDSWISAILASTIGFIAVWIAFKLHKSFPDKTFIQYSEDIVGKLLGKVIGFFYLLFFLHFNGIVIREYSDFVGGTFLNQTPMMVVTGIFLLFSAYAVHGGLEVIGRLGQMLLPFFVIPLFFFLLILLIYMDPKNILPIMENGIVPSLKGSYVLSSWFSELFLISFLLPYLKKESNGLKWGFYTAVGIMFTLFAVNLVVLLDLGRFSFYALNPLLTAVRYISLGDFFEHVEVGLLAIWILGTFVKITVLFFIVTKAASEWLKLTDERVLIFPLGFLQMVISFWVSKSFQQLSDFLLYYLPSYFFTFFIAIPFFLLLINAVKNKVQKSKSSV